MKTPSTRTIAAVGLGLILTTPCLLRATEPKVKEREIHQQERIAEGVESGELTPAETARLEKREAELKKQIHDERSANGGKLTPEERKQVNKELDGISKRIHHQKHDKQKVPHAK